MQTLDARPTDEDVNEILGELVLSNRLLGRQLGDSGAAETLEPEPTRNDIANVLVDAYLEGTGVYMEDAEPGIPPDWRSLRAHRFSRDERGMTYRCDEYLPDLKRFEELGPIDDPAQYDGILTAKLAELADALKSSLGKPKAKKKQAVEFEWGGDRTSPTWGALYLKLYSAELKIGGGDAAPWRCVSLEIQLLGAPRT